MKTKAVIISIILIITLLNVSSVAQADTFEYDTSIRVGLRYYYEEVESITLYNSSLLIGYEVGGHFQAEYEALSNSYFNLTKANMDFLISLNTFNSFDEANIKVNLIRELGYEAYCGSVSYGNWKVYVGSGQSDIASVFEALEGANSLNFEVVSDNGLRTMLTYSSGYPIVFENSYNHVQFDTNNTRSGIPIIDLGRRSYRGRIEVGRYHESGVSAINIVDIEDYLYGVLPSEMPTEWPLEALKAQAVAARNYAVYHTSVNPKYTSRPYPIDDTVRSQVYKGYAVEVAKANQAVDETAGVLIYYGGEVIPSYFFSTSGGHTESSANVWTGNVAYLQGVPDIYETDPFKDPWTDERTGTELVQELNDNGIYIGELSSIQLTYTDSGRVYSMNFIGSEGSHRVEKETIRYWFGFYSRKFKVIEASNMPNSLIRAQSVDGVTEAIDLASAYVINGDMAISALDTSLEQLQLMSSVNIDNVPLIYGQAGKYIFVGQGYGHGVGMSQSGAKGMANEGFSYDEILTYYYTGVEVY